jgi:ribonuclease VapC
MVIDTSSLVAILFAEPDAAAFEAAIAADPVRLVSAPSLLETAIVVERRYGEAGGRELDLLVHKAGIEVVAFTAEQVEVARAAFLRFGKGNHPAGLNYGDCFSYALSALSGEPLLSKGGDFGLTDAATVTPGTTVTTP